MSAFLVCYDFDIDLDFDPFFCVIIC